MIWFRKESPFMTKRTVPEEIEHRIEQRMKYFENPNYRKWSDFLSKTSNGYGNRTDDFMIMAYITNDDDVRRFAINDVKLFDKDGNPMVNWEGLYQYVDERLNDERNRLLSELTEPSVFVDYSVFGNSSIAQILDKYRDQLYKPNYDII